MPVRMLEVCLDERSTWPAVSFPHFFAAPKKWGRGGLGDGVAPNVI